MSTDPRSVFFYVQHLLGIGHLARASLVSQALVGRGAQVTLVMGGHPVSGFPGAGINVIELPAVSAGPGGFGDLVDGDGTPIDAAFRQQRCGQLVDELVRSKPDIVLTEAFPFGRRQMRFELLPMLAQAQALEPRPLIACSVRDILQQRSDRKLRETVDLIAAHFDLVLVHADPKFVQLEETFPLAAQFADKIAYTGIVSSPPGALQDERFDVVVSAGGGVAGEQMLRAAVAAKNKTSLARSQWCVLTGPNLDQRITEELKQTAGPGISFYASRPDFRALLANATLSISQAGYNTSADILRAGCKSVMVPYAHDGETEQTLRAEKLAERGLVTLLSEDDPTAENLAQAIETRLQMPRIAAAHGIDLDGANKSAQVLFDQTEGS